MLIKCRKVMDGPGPFEAIIELQTRSGLEEAVVPKELLKGNNALEVGQILGVKNGEALIALPRESASGKWRLWVPASEIKQTA